MAEGLDGLRIYRLAEALADEVWAEVLTWSPFARQTVGRQLVEKTAELAPQLNAYIRTLGRRSQGERRQRSDETPLDRGVQVPVP